MVELTSKLIPLQILQIKPKRVLNKLKSVMEGGGNFHNFPVEKLHYPFFNEKVVILVLRLPPPLCSGTSYNEPTLKIISGIAPAHRSMYINFQ